MKSKGIIILVLTIIFGAAYFWTDNNLYYYGRSKYNILNNSLPLGLYPDYWKYGQGHPTTRFYIRDEYGFTAVGKQTFYKFKSDTIKIDQIIKYGFNDEELIALVKGVDSMSYYMVCERNPNMQAMKKYQLNIHNKKMDINMDKYTWIKISDNKKIVWLKDVRISSVLIYIITTLSIVFGALILRKAQKIKEKESKENQSH